jgi:hypothetical protein
MREQAGRGSSEQEQASGRWRAPGTAGQSVPDGVGEHKYARAVIVADITQAKLASESLVWRTERSSREKREEKKRLRTRVEHSSSLLFFFFFESAFHIRLGYTYIHG